MLNFHYIEPHLVSYEGHTFNTCSRVERTDKDARFANVNVVGSTQCPRRSGANFGLWIVSMHILSCEQESLISKVIFQIALFCFVLRLKKAPATHSHLKAMFFLFQHCAVLPLPCCVLLHTGSF